MCKWAKIVQVLGCQGLSVILLRTSAGRGGRMGPHMCRRIQEYR
jgi:hypothetical protein